MKRIFAILLILLVSIGYCNAQTTQVIKSFYIEIPEYEAKQNGFDERYGDRFFKKTKLENGVFEIEVGDKIDSNFYGINLTKYFMLFQYNPYLFKWDKGYIKVTNGWNAGEFTKKSNY